MVKSAVDALTAVARALSGVSSVLILALALVTVIDVMGRYGFDAPLSGAFELTELLLGLVVFLALPRVTSRNEHVRADLIAHRLSSRATRLLEQVSQALSAMVLFGLAVLLFRYGIALQADGFRTNALELPLSSVAFAGALGCGVSGLFAAARLFRRSAP